MFFPIMQLYYSLIYPLVTFPFRGTTVGVFCQRTGSFCRNTYSISDQGFIQIVIGMIICFGLYIYGILYISYYIYIIIYILLLYIYIYIHIYIYIFILILYIYIYIIYIRILYNMLTYIRTYYIICNK